MTRPRRAAAAEPQNAAPFDAVRDYLAAHRGDEASFRDVIALAELTADSMQSFVSAIDRTLYRELREIADYITTMREEIGLLQASDLKASRIPAAGEQLSHIVAATEVATNTIMESAETILGADDSDPVAYKALVNDNVMAIFEACSFQDLTGQRIAKVVETLEMIESRVGRFAAATEAGGDPMARPLMEDARARRARELILSGPQAAGVAIAQTEIDALMAEPYNNR